MKHYLAFKGVNSDLKSAWVGENVASKLSRKYAIGKTMKAHPRFPFYLVNQYDSCSLVLNTGCDECIRRVILVRVPANHITRELPFCGRSSDYVCCQCQTNNPTLAQLIPLSRYSESYSSLLGTTRLTVLEEVDKSQFRSVKSAMDFYVAKYGIPCITQYQAL